MPMVSCFSTTLPRKLAQQKHKSNHLRLLREFPFSKLQSVKSAHKIHGATITISSTFIMVNIFLFFFRLYCQW